MSQEFQTIDDKLSIWIKKQKMFFVSTAPLSKEGYVNLSPKGMDTFRIINGHEVAYLDLTGSGAETIAHIKENGRITIMFCAFDGAAKIVRIQGKGEVFEKTHLEFEKLASLFPEITGARAIIKISATRISESCGYGVPHYTYHGDRDTLEKWSIKKGEKGLVDYQKENNSTSLDGLPGLNT